MRIEILMHLRTLRKTRNDVFLGDSVSHDGEGNEITLLDILPDESERVEDRVARSQQEQRLSTLLLARLGRRERQVVQLRYGFWGTERRTQREIAKELGISRSYVSRIEKKALRKIGAELQKEREP